MHVSNTAAPAKGVGSNAVFGWGRCILSKDNDITEIHGFGITVTKKSETTFELSIDPGIRPQYWTVFAQPDTTATEFIVLPDFTNGTALLTADLAADTMFSFMFVGAGP